MASRPPGLQSFHGRWRVLTCGRPRFYTKLTTSLSRGPEEPRLLQSTIPGHFAGIVSRFGDRPAVISRHPATRPRPEFPDTIQSYETLDLLSNHLAHSLRSLGVKKGDRVGVMLGNCAEKAALTYALFKLGAILAPLNPILQAKQVVSALAHLEASVFMVGSVSDLAYKPCRGRDNLPLLQALVPNLEAAKVEAPEVPSLREIVVVDNSAFHPTVKWALASSRCLTSYDALVRGFSQHSCSTSSRPVTPDAALSASDVINIQFTSGTTSQPKAAMLTHMSILNNGALIAHGMGLQPSDRIVCPPPLFHCFGSVLGYMATATTGACILFPSPAFDPVASVRMVADYTATGLYGVPTMFVAMLEAVQSGQGGDEKAVPLHKLAAFPTHLHKGIAAGSPVPEALMGRLFATFGLRDLVVCYGMTETSPVSCMTTPADPLAKRIASVGRAMPHTVVKVVDPLDRARMVPMGERGELATSGYLVMQGYWHDQARTDEVRVREPDGVWMYTGDEASMDPDGYVSITGRIKDLIIRGGENIHPLEIENCLFQHPLIAEASVVGVPDARHGEVVAAFVVVHSGVRTTPEHGHEKYADEEKTLTEKDVRAWVAGNLSTHLVPQYVFWVDHFPKTASGKIQKFKLRHLARDRAIASTTN